MKTENQSNDTAAKSGVDSSALLVGLTVRSVLTLQNNEIGEGLHIEAGGPEKESGKYVGWITIGEYHRPLVSTKPIFDSAEQAETHMRSVVQAAKEYSLANAKDEHA